MWTNGHFRRTFGFGRKQSYHIRFRSAVVGKFRWPPKVGYRAWVAEAGRGCAWRRESLASLCTDWLCKDNRESWLRCLRLHLVHQLALLLAYVFNLLFWLYGLGPDTIDFRFQFRFLAESHTLLSVAHTVSAECVTSLSAYFRFWPKVQAVHCTTSTFGRPLHSRPLAVSLPNRILGI